MHFLLSALNLLSQGTFILGVVSVPTSSLSSVDPVETGAARIPIPDITKHGYSITKSTVDDHYGAQYKINHGAIEVATLGIHPNLRRVNVMEAENWLDTSEDKIPLRGIILSLWKGDSGEEVKDLKQIFWRNIMDPDIHDSVSRAVNLMPDEESDILSFQSPSATYTDLMTSNRAGVGVTKMLAEYEGMEGRSVEAVYIVKWKPWGLAFEIS